MHTYMSQGLHLKKMSLMQYMHQVTANSVRLVSSTTRELLHEWNAPLGYSVNVATASASQVVFQLLLDLFPFFKFHR